MKTQVKTEVIVPVVVVKEEPTKKTNNKRKKLIKHFQDIKNLSTGTLSSLNIKPDLDMERMLRGQMSVESYVDMVFYPNIISKL